MWGSGESESCGGMCGEVLREVWKSVLGCGEMWESLGEGEEKFGGLEEKFGR